MDFGKIINLADEGIWVNLEHPVTGETLDVALKLVGSDSAKYRERQREMQDKRLSKGKFKLSAAELETEAVGLIAACVVDWKNVVVDDKPLACTDANVRKIIKEQKWVREQIDVAIADRANFIKGY